MNDFIPEPINQSFVDYFTKAGIELIKKKEEYLLQLVKALGISEEEFVRDYIIENYPVNIMTVDDTVLRESYTIVFEEKFKVRRKTDEEKLED